MPRSLLPTTLLCLPLAGCLAAPPPAACTGRLALVRASDEATACRVALLLDDLVPRVRAELDGSVDPPIEVWVQDDLRVYSLPGTASSAGGFYVPLLGRIHASSALLAEDSGVGATVLAHELVHQLRDAAWGTLSRPLEEGLADLVASRVAPEGAAHVRAERVLRALPEGRSLHISASFTGAAGELSSHVSSPSRADGWLGEMMDGPDVSPQDYARALALMTRLDELGRLGELRAACLAASGDEAVTLEDAARLAGLDLAQDADALVSRLFDASALAALLAGSADEVAGDFARRFPPEPGDPVAHLLRIDPVFRVVGGGATVRGADVPGFLEAWVRHRAAARSLPETAGTDAGRPRGTDAGRP